MNRINLSVRRIGRPDKGRWFNTEPKRSQENDLERAVDGAELMLNFAAQQGVTVKREVLEVITGARELFEQGKLCGTPKADFYSNFTALSQAVSPVTVSSLRSCLVYKKFPCWLSSWFGEDKAPKWLPKWAVSPRWETDAKMALRFYRGMGLAGLIILVFLQGYWVVGSYLMENVPILSETKREEGVKQEAQWQLEDRENTEDNASAQAVTVPAPTPILVATPAAGIEVVSNSAKNSPAEDKKIKDEIDGITKTRIHACETLLFYWAPFYNQIKGQFTKSEFYVDVNNRWAPGIIARCWLNVIQTYLLPLLYGALGAIAYVVRLLISEIDTYTYRYMTKSPLNSRILLGSLAGLAIGWFYTTSKGEGGQVLQTISPLALAFLAGYSVELLFSAMDRLINAFSSKNPSAVTKSDSIAHH